MTETPEPVLPPEEARRNFLVFTLIRLVGVGVLIGGLFIAREGLGIGSGAMILVGVVSLFLKPKWLGLTR
jgi:uncharacterized Zn-binding protein involved in type VI secretion